jgi:hypothetical protein
MQLLGARSHTPRQGGREITIFCEWLLPILRNDYCRQLANLTSGFTSLSTCAFCNGSPVA